MLKQDSYEGVTAVYGKALEIWIGHRQFCKNQTWNLSNLERYEEALANFDKALEIEPDFQLAWANRGFALYYLGRYEEALDSCNKALALAPNDYVAWSNKGFTLMNLERYEEAVSSYDKVLKIQHTNHSAWYNKACCHILQGNVELALNALQQAIALSPDEYRDRLKTDSDFDSVRGTEQFQVFIGGQSQLHELNRIGN